MFSKPNPFEESVAAATNENLTSENWELILGVCDKVSRGTPENARDCATAVTKRFTSRNANVQLYALALSEALVKNCGITVHREISSRVFTNALSKLIHDKTTHESVRKRALELIQVCSLEFSTDSSLGLMNEVYHSLRAEGIQFPNPQKPKKEYTQTELDKQKEEEELQLALALSLSESEKRSTYRASSSVTKATASSASNVGTTDAAAAPKPKQDVAPKVSRVRALYDFQPTEQGELGFQKGDIIRVIESVYRDWWKGELRGQMGIFPVNYVEKIVDPSPADLLKEAQMEAEVMGELQNVDRLLDMLTRIDPQKDAFSENEELQNLYNNSLAIRPKLVRLIEKYSLKKDELIALNEKFLHARSMYDRMLGSSLAKYTSPGAPSGHEYSTPQQTQGYGVYPPQQQQQQQPMPQQPTYSGGPPSESSYQAYQQQPPQQLQQQPTAYPQGYPHTQASPGVHHQQQQYPPAIQQQQQPPQQQPPQQMPQQSPQQAPPPAYGYPETAPVQQQQQPQSPSNPPVEQPVAQQQQPQQAYAQVQPSSTPVSYPAQPSYSTPYPPQQPQQQQQPEQQPQQSYNPYGMGTPMTPQQQHPQPTAYPQYPPQQQHTGANQQAYAQNY
ncbi:hypothetical protein BDB00DRAFT_859171 [Zychaea mexicana]|uniref:uncharacterized protein n=1 Tax=Zychaea mexicana TaxID=64656 RepID=UPI0022FEA7BB|nr:uncharacterized protein BDB00DRAFT_859171 [Zychaea mexicana]KAI9477704.1 hypothetical protein BDB00DRAFT_859171 [Zychaea mexicana]